MSHCWQAGPIFPCHSTQEGGGVGLQGGEGPTVQSQPRQKPIAEILETASLKRGQNGADMACMMVAGINLNFISLGKLGK